MSTPHAPATGAPSEPHAGIVALLRALGIRTITYSLSGGGDDGDVTLEEVVRSGDCTAQEIPDLPVGLDVRGAVRTLPNTLIRIAGELPEGDWVNNEGGSGTVTIRPFETEHHRRFECDMIYGSDDDHEDYQDDEDFADVEFELDAGDHEEPVPAIRLIGDAGDGR